MCFVVYGWCLLVGVLVGSVGGLLISMWNGVVLVCKISWVLLLMMVLRVFSECSRLYSCGELV